MKKKVTMFICFLAIFLPMYVHAGCAPVQTIPRLWNNVENDLIVDISILSKVSTLESIVDNLASSITKISSSFNSEIATITSYVEAIDTEVINIESTTDNLNSFITGPLESKVNLINKTDSSILSLVNVIDTRTSSIYSLDQNIASFIDLELATDQSIFSEVMIIDSNISNLNLNCSGVDQILQTEYSILSKVNVIDTRTNNIYSLDQIIASYAQNIDQQVLTIQSATNTINSVVNTTINSKLDLIQVTDQAIRSVANIIDTRTSSIYSLDQIISSKITNYTTLATSVQSAANVIDSKINNFNCITSLSGQLAPLDQSILSTVMVLDTRTSNIQSTTTNLFSLDQTINSNLSTITNIQQSTSSKVDVSIALDTTIASILNNINSTISALSCSNIGQLVQIDQSILSTVNVIDTRTSNIQSNVNNIYNIDQSISSKIDLDNSIDTTTQSTVSIINSKTNLISSNIAALSNVTNANAALVNALSNCCTTTNNANTVLTSLYNSIIADQSYDTISISFQYGIPNTIMNSYTQTGGTITNANSMAILTTSTSAGSIAEIQTKNVITYRSGHEAFAYFSVAFTGSFAATSSQFIGPIDYQNGFAIGFNGTTFGVTLRSNTVNSFTPQSQFNGDKLDGTGTSQFTYNPAALNLFRIAYGYLGASIIKFQILTSYGNWVTFHTIYYPNTAAVPSILQPFLPITARVENLSGTSVLTLQTASWNGGIVAQPSNNSYRYFQFNVTKNPGTTNQTLMFILRNPLTLNNQPNKINVRITGIGGGLVATGRYTIIKNATVTGTSYTDVSTGNSALQVSTAGTYSAGTGRNLFVYSTQFNGQGFGPLLFTNNPFAIVLFPGETLTLTTQGSNTSQSALLMWEEQF